MPLTDTHLRNAKPKDKPYKLFDGDGLYLAVQPNGSKYWRLKYCFLKREKTLSIGSYPHISLMEAREHRFNAKKLLLNNIDPSTQKKEDKRQAFLQAANTFKAVATSWYDLNQEREKWVPEHAERIWRRLELHIFPDLGNRPITSIKTPDVIIPLRKLEKQGTLETARKLSQIIAAIFRHAIHEGVIEHNPADQLKGVLTPPKTTNFPTIHASELPVFFQRLQKAQTRRQNKIAILLLMLTMLRPGELQKFTWAEIDHEKKQGVIPPERMKMRREHIVPLSSQALTLLEELRTLTGYSKYLFPAQQHRKNPFMSENTINDILQKMGYKNKLVGHGFRSLASTTLNEESEFDKDIIEAQLAHMDKDQIRAIYNRADYLKERAEMMQWWGNYVESKAKLANYAAPPPQSAANTSSIW